MSVVVPTWVIANVWGVMADGGENDEGIDHNCL